MQTSFGMDRLRRLFPTGGEGPFQTFFRSDSSFFFAKTGTLSGVVTLSGFLYTRKQKLLLFSVLVNNHQAPITAVRQAVETFLQHVRSRY
jgi:D-alanyl-D-alanine carboxypeptidase/D-alanyl-D-alanine-endopeptidase (penicillin-binding protein 4)